jgi:hypothetical protein
LAAGLVVQYKLETRISAWKDAKMVVLLAEFEIMLQEFLKAAI